MAYLLGIGRKQPLVQAEATVAGETTPAWQRYVLLDASTKRPVPGQQMRRKGQALQIWVNGELVQELPGFFANTSDDTGQILSKTDDVDDAVEATPQNSAAQLNDIADETWHTQATVPLPGGLESNHHWRESDLLAKADISAQETHFVITDVTAQINPAMAAKASAVLGCGLRRWCASNG